MLNAYEAQALNSEVQPACETMISERAVQDEIAGTGGGLWRFKDGARELKCGNNEDRTQPHNSILRTNINELQSL